MRRPLWLSVSVALGFFAGGMLLSAVEWQRAWRPPLRIAFEVLAREARAQAALEHRRMPEDDEAFAVVEGVLRADAAPMESGVSLSVAVDRLVNQTEPTDGREKGAVPLFGTNRTKKGYRPFFRRRQAASS